MSTSKGEQIHEGRSSSKVHSVLGLDRAKRPRAHPQWLHTGLTPDDSALSRKAWQVSSPPSVWPSVTRKFPVNSRRSPSLSLLQTPRPRNQTRGRGAATPRFGSVLLRPTCLGRCQFENPKKEEYFSTLLGALPPALRPSPRRSLQAAPQALLGSVIFT